MKIELQRLVDGVWYVYGNYDMSKPHDATAFGEAVSELAKHFNIRTVVSYTDVEKQVEELENKIADIKANCDLAIEGRDIKIKELETENAELKEKIEVLECDNYNANCNLNLITDHLTKATEIIKSLIALHYNPAVTKDDLKKQDKILEQARQFIKEIEK